MIRFLFSDTFKDQLKSNQVLFTHFSKVLDLFNLQALYLVVLGLISLMFLSYCTSYHFALAGVLTKSPQNSTVKKTMVLTAQDH